MVVKILNSMVSRQRKIVRISKYSRYGESSRVAVIVMLLIFSRTGYGAIDNEFINRVNSVLSINSGKLASLTSFTNGLSESVGLVGGEQLVLKQPLELKSLKELGWLASIQPHPATPFGDKVPLSGWSVHSLSHPGWFQDLFRPLFLQWYATPIHTDSWQKHPVTLSTEPGFGHAYLLHIPDQAVLPTNIRVKTNDLNATPCGCYLSGVVSGDDRLEVDRSELEGQLPEGLKPYCGAVGEGETRGYRSVPRRDDQESNKQSRNDSKRSQQSKKGKSYSGSSHSNNRVSGGGSGSGGDKPPNRFNSSNKLGEYISLSNKNSKELKKLLLELKGLKTYYGEYFDPQPHTNLLGKIKSFLQLASRAQSTNIQRLPGYEDYSAISKPQGNDSSKPTIPLQKTVRLGHIFPNQDIFFRILQLPEILCVVLPDAVNEITAADFEQHITFLDNLLQGRGYETIDARLRLEKNEQAQTEATQLSSMEFHPTQEQPYPALNFNIMPPLSHGAEQMSVAQLLARILRGYWRVQINESNNAEYINLQLSKKKKFWSFLDYLLKLHSAKQGQD